VVLLKPFHEERRKPGEGGIRIGLSLAGMRAALGFLKAWRRRKRGK
jgi:hypothetical protein